MVAFRYFSNIVCNSVVYFFLFLVKSLGLFRKLSNLLPRRECVISHSMQGISDAKIIFLVTSCNSLALINHSFSSQIRVPAFLDLFMQSLFKPGAKINQDHKHKYIHILAYAASVVEMWKKVMFGSVNNIIFTYSGLTVLKKMYGHEVTQFKIMYSA